MKLYVICLMHSSLDGRTHPSRWRPKGAGTDWFEKIHDELGGDARVIGRVTGSEFAKGQPYPATDMKLPRETGSRGVMRKPMESCSIRGARSAGAARTSAAIRSSWC